MVAISLYRGNLHRVPDTPRRWLMPKHTITLKDFKSLTRKREKTLSRLLSNKTPTTTSNPNPNPNSISVQEHEFVGDNGCTKPQTTDAVANGNKIKIERVNEDPLPQHQTVGDGKDQSRSDGEPKRKGIGDISSSHVTKPVTVPESGCDAKDDKIGVSGRLQGGEKDEEQQPTTSVQPAAEINKVDLQSDGDKKKRDIEQNLKVLNDRKHKLVLMLKQILNAEEELKSRNSIQASVVRPPVSMQVEGATDSGSNSRQVVNKVGAEGNYCGDLEGESEDGPNQNIQPRQSQQMRSTSPSASSPLWRLSHASTQHTMVPQTNRPSLGIGVHTQTASSSLPNVASSPSRFAPPGHPTSLPPVSVSGTHFSASSPSPAASGGTSVFRESRMTSPSWN